MLITESLFREKGKRRFNFNRNLGQFCVVLTMFLSNTALAQSKLKQTLNTGSVAAWKTFLSGSNVSLQGRKVYREIIPGYFEESVEIREDTGRNRSVDQHINLLIHEGHIIAWAINRPTIVRHQAENTDSFISNKDFNLFKNAFKTKYKVEFNKQYLFENTVFSLNLCGNDGGETVEYQQLEMIMQHKNVSVLQTWLRSANVEKQLYAIYAFDQYEQMKIPIDDETSVIINYVRHKDGNINSCSGCLFSSRKIADAFKPF